jgi:hypothetical protein
VRCTAPSESGKIVTWLTNNPIRVQSDYRARLGFNIGPNASIDTIYRALDDVSRLLSYASEVQEEN